MSKIHKIIEELKDSYYGIISVDYELDELDVYCGNDGYIDQAPVYHGQFNRELGVIGIYKVCYNAGLQSLHFHTQIFPEIVLHFGCCCCFNNHMYPSHQLI